MKIFERFIELLVDDVEKRSKRVVITT